MLNKPITTLLNFRTLKQTARRKVMLQAVISISNMFDSKKQGKLPPITEPLLLMPAHKLSKMIKDGSTSSVKLIELYTDRIKQVHPFINAMAQDRFKEAHEEAEKLDKLLADFRSGKQESDFTADELEMLRSPLFGVPVSIKESVAVKNMRHSCGLWHRRKEFATDDAVVVKNVRRFGQVPICTTNVPECTLFWADCQNKVYGRSHNPYDLSRVTGASSGGEGSLIGSGASIVGIGTDIGGSLRTPAHFCGIFSHKPSPFLVSCDGNYPIVKESRLRMFTFGPMCRYASDLRPLFKCILSDKDNHKRDTYHKFQPENISTIRDEVMQSLDNTIEFNRIKFYYFDLNNASKSNSKLSIHVQPEIVQGQREVIDHFSSKFGCQTEEINLDKFFNKILITWQCMLNGAGAIDHETAYDPDELNNMFHINSVAMEFLKMPFGLSKHTKESLLIMTMGSAVPRDHEKANILCTKFEKLAEELRTEMSTIIKDNCVLVMPTLPTVAYKNNVALMKTDDVRFPVLFNVLQMPVSHATIRLDKKHRLPFGVSIASKCYNDVLSISVAEEIELAFGGWTPPLSVSDSVSQATKNDSIAQVDTKQLSPQASAQA